MEPIWALGLMTGTVLDGNIDIALIRTDGVDIQEFGPWTLAPYPAELGPVLRNAMAAAGKWAFLTRAGDLRRGGIRAHPGAIRRRD